MLKIKVDGIYTLLKGHGTDARSRGHNAKTVLLLASTVYLLGVQFLTVLPKEAVWIDAFDAPSQSDPT